MDNTDGWRPHLHEGRAFLSISGLSGFIKLTFFNIFTLSRLDFKCSDNQFKCTNGECVKKNLLCDGDYACKDGSDEENCACPTNKFQCKGGGCLPATALCDDTKEDGCDGEDEINCRKLPDFITCIVLYFPLPCAKKNKTKSITNKQQQQLIIIY